MVSFFALSGQEAGLVMAADERILNLVIVEDEVNIRDCLVNLFPWQAQGVHVLASFESGQEALYYILSHEVDIVLSDIRLRGSVSGLDMVRMLRENNCRAGVIILTGYRQFQYMQQSIRYHVNDFLLKPVKYDELSESISRIRAELETNMPVPAAESEAADTGNSTDDVSGRAAESDETEHRLISAARAYLMSHTPDATLERTALTVGLSPSYFSRLFHRVTGETFSDFLMRLRMETAARLLTESDLKLFEVALRAGYDNPKNFSRAFRGYYELTPTQYRDKYWKKGGQQGQIQ